VSIHPYYAVVVSTIWDIARQRRAISRLDDMAATAATQANNYETTLKNA
jgi:hypothetical protein